MKKIFFTALIFCYACSQENKQGSQLSLKDTIPKIKTPDALIVEEKITEPNFTGVYKLLTTRNEEYYIKHKIDLTQTNDSVYVIYSASYYVPGRESFAKVNGNGKGVITDMDMMKGAMVLINITDRVVDTLKFNFFPWYKTISIPTKEYGTAFALRFNVEKNTIEHNYAGGEWDTWKK